jgi:hypothetical protein
MKKVDYDDSDNDDDDDANNFCLISFSSLFDIRFGLHYGAWSESFITF